MLDRDKGGAPAAEPMLTRTALITGANRGLGRELVLGLARSGIAVGLLGRSQPGLVAVAEEVAAAGGRAVVGLADVRDFGAVQAAIAAVQSELGGIDLLVNSAGVIDSVEVPVWQADPNDWWDVVETDLRGPFHLVRAVVPGMVERGAGRVINLSSGIGANDREIYSAYGAAKAGLFRLTGNLHLAGFARGLRAFEVSPGTVQTEMTAAMPVHAGRTDWTAPERVLDLVLAVAHGELDPWSGCFLRAGVDTVDSLRKAAQELADGSGAVPAPTRRLAVTPWSPTDPLA
ncbi:MAG TPA: SDR family oxidoreductase [Kineosporiaceae bacterium]|nr:SDR family oxidoreductase [Kineosporiaceae bacterium]